jgi:predicted O-linked N-acetylglucosamine transferase (SPINDLY family)
MNIRNEAEPSDEVLTASLLMDLAVKYHEAGELKEAEVHYLKVLQLESRNSDARHLLGVIAMQNERYNEAIELIMTAIRINDSEPAYHSNLGIVHLYQGRLPEAIDYFEHTLRLQPDFVEAHNNLGEALAADGRFSEAVPCYQRALEINPDFILAHYNLGNALRKKGNSDAAIACYHRILESDPNHAMALYNLGLTLDDIDELDRAADCYRRALSLAPNLSEAQIDLGNVLRKQGDNDAAITCLQQVLDTDPCYVIALYNLGLVYFGLDKFSQAADYFQRALVINPNHRAMHNHLGLALKDMGRMEESLAHFRKALEIDPTYTIAHSNFLLYLNYAPGYDRPEIFLEHQRFNARCAAHDSNSSTFQNSRHPKRRLKIGYVSPDFRNHANARFFEPVLAHHTQEQFEIFCYYTDDRIDDDTRRLKQYTDHWADCMGLTDDAFFDQIKRDQIDILVDLAGHTANHRLPVFARKPAPVQVAYLGYPNTRGLPAIDYRITDRHIEPEGDADRFSSESLIRMPDSWYCFRPSDKSPSVNDLPAIQNGYITFGSLNQYCKTNSDVLDLWAQVLLAVPESRLLVNTHTQSLSDPRIREPFEAHFDRFGISPERLILDDERPSDTHLRTYHRIDIGLDTFPHTGGSTTCEALWMGVPVITLAGESLVARMSLSILSTLGLNELIAQTQEEYIDVCIKVATDMAYLQSLRKSMREKMQSSSLMDPDTFTRHLEMSYRKMWQDWCKEYRDIPS